MLSWIRQAQLLSTSEQRIFLKINLLILTYQMMDKFQEENLKM